MVRFWFDGPEDAATLVLYAHGAGTPADAPFLVRTAAELAARGLRVARFEFPFMAARRSGRRRPPDRMPVLVDTVGEAVAALPRRHQRLCLLGKSMGARVACLAAGGVGAARVACLGFPFHPPRTPERSRLGELLSCAAPCLVVQGTRDPFGGRAELAGTMLPAGAAWHWVEDADHDLALPRRLAAVCPDPMPSAMDAVHAFFCVGQDPAGAGPMRA